MGTPLYPKPNLKMAIATANFMGVDGGVGAVPPRQEWNLCTPRP
jgi:hypothetical protein